METKFKEELVTTTDFEVMRDKFIGKRLVRSWSEDFVDEDNGEVITVERNELIFEKGTKIENEQLSIINFHLQSGDIKEVVVSNQQRFGEIGKRHPSVWQATAMYNNKKYNFFLYANSIEIAKLIVQDYIEQIAQGTFTFLAIKELGVSTLIPENFGLNEEEQGELYEADYYKIEVAILEDEVEHNQEFIVKATDAEQAKERIISFYTLKKEDAKTEISATIISAKTIPCDYVIDYEFSIEYLENENEA